jgi:hypothetical protein
MEYPSMMDSGIWVAGWRNTVQGTCRAEGLHCITPAEATPAIAAISQTVVAIVSMTNSEINQKLNLTTENGGLWRHLNRRR